MQTSCLVSFGPGKSEFQFQYLKRSAFKRSVKESRLSPPLETLSVIPTVAFQVASSQHLFCLKGCCHLQLSFSIERVISLTVQACELSKHAKRSSRMSAKHLKHKIGRLEVFSATLTRQLALQTSAATLTRQVHL